MATQQQINSYLKNRYEMLSECREKGLKTLEQIILKNIKEAKKLTTVKIEKKQQLTIW